MLNADTDLTVSIPARTHHPCAFAANNQPEAVAPEKELTIFAYRLAIVEKAASLVGVLAFVWATVVLLGGFIANLRKEDFWVVTFILVVEGVRIFSRSHELQWQREAIIEARNDRRSLSRLTSAVQNIGSSILLSGRPRRRSSQSPVRADTASSRLSRSPGRTWSPPEAPVLPFGGYLSSSRNVSNIFHWLQLLSALTCVPLSVWRISDCQAADNDDGNPDSEIRNLKAGLIIFYGLAIAEALLFLLERAFWEVKVTAMNLFQTVSADCKLEDVDLVTIKRFYYDAYSRCIDGSIFDGLKMDLVTYGENLLISDLFEEQLMGVRILRSFATNPIFAFDTLRKIETTSETVERLLEMLNWKSAFESDLRRYAAEVVAKLAEKEQNVIRIAGFAGAVQSVSGLLHLEREYSEKPEEIELRPVAVEESGYTYSLLGLKILRDLARDYENCEKIGATRGLLAKIIDLTLTHQVVLAGNGTEDKRVEVVSHALQVVKILTSAKGDAGTALREKIADTLFTMISMRQILLHGKSRPEMRLMAIEILTNLAMDVKGRERIGATGRIPELLLEIFLESDKTGDALRESAGCALAMLALESEENCDAMVRIGVLKKLALVLKREEEEKMKVVTRRLLKNLCAYSGDKSRPLLSDVAATLPTVIQAILKEKGRSLEISIGLAAQILKLVTAEDARNAFIEAGVDENIIINKLCQVLINYSDARTYEIIKVPGMRRFTVELMMQMAKNESHHITAFRERDVENKLTMVRRTASPLESFNVFTGNVGLCPHHQTVQSLVNEALEMFSSN